MKSSSGRTSRCPVCFMKRNVNCPSWDSRPWKRMTSTPWWVGSVWVTPQRPPLRIPGRSLVVVEYLAPVIEWHRNGLVPLGETLTGDQRCRLTQADFFALSQDAKIVSTRKTRKKTRCHPSGYRSHADQRIASDERPVLHGGRIERARPALETRWGIRSLGGRRTRSLLCRSIEQSLWMGRGPYHRIRQPHHRGQFEGRRLRCQKLPVKKETVLRRGS